GAEVTYAPDGSSRTRRAFGGSLGVARELAGRDWDRARTRPAWPPAGGIALLPGQAMADPARLARAQGCLLGQVAGDNLGADAEGMRAEAVRASPRYGGSAWLLADGGLVLAGQPTDDSEMALALAR